MHEKGCSRATAFRVLAKRKLARRTKREKLLAETKRFSSLIKPSDNWDFSTVHYPRIDDEPATYGYIPGDLYANALFYFARPGDLVVAPMAGSGQVMRVYGDRAVWTKGLEQPWDIDLRMFDLTPRGPYKALISQHDLCAGFPAVGRAPDYVVLDVPYLGLCRRQYSKRADDIANMDEAGWIAAMHAIARSCAAAGARRCTVIVPTWVDTDKAYVVPCPEIVREAWRGVGYRLHRVCYASKRIQAARTDRMPVLNNKAKATRTPLSDISEVLTFDRPA
jgi:ParB family chromosome partitioning protein